MGCYKIPAVQKEVVQLSDITDDHNIEQQSTASLWQDGSNDLILLSDMPEDLSLYEPCLPSAR